MRIAAALTGLALAGCASTNEEPYGQFRAATPSPTNTAQPRHSPAIATNAAASPRPANVTAAPTLEQQSDLNTLPPETGEALLVEDSPTDITRATVSTWTRTRTGWTSAAAATSGHIGVNGISDAADRRQGDGTTPDGTYPIVGAFGLGPAHTAMPYTQITENLYWVYDPNDPTTYNSFQTPGPDSAWSPSPDWSEHMTAHGEQYRYGAVLGYNGAGRTGGDVDTSKGGGIFLHVDDGTPTAGCISLPAPDVARILAWLDPSAHPQIVIRRT